jgi:hypothetical protein
VNQRGNWQVNYPSPGLLPRGRRSNPLSRRMYTGSHKLKASFTADQLLFVIQHTTADRCIVVCSRPNECTVQRAVIKSDQRAGREGETLGQYVILIVQSITLARRTFVSRRRVKVREKEITNERKIASCCPDCNTRSYSTETVHVTI